MAEWYSDRVLLTNFGQVLVSAEILETTDQMKRFFREPYRYNDLFEAWKENGYPQEEDEEWDDFIAQIDTGEEETEEETTEEEEE